MCPLVFLTTHIFIIHTLISSPHIHIDNHPHTILLTQAAHEQLGGGWDEEWVRSYSADAQERFWQKQRQYQGEEGEEEGYTSGGGWWQQAQRAWGAWGRRQQQQQRQQQEGGYGQQQGTPRGAPRATSTSFRDPRGLYKTLGVDPDATQEEIQASFRGLALRHHPDRVSGGAVEKAEAAETMKRINEAYSVLRNRDKRRAYDGRYRG